MNVKCFTTLFALFLVAILTACGTTERRDNNLADQAMEPSSLLTAQKGTQTTSLARLLEPL